jgi:hypothetical protein
MAPFSVAEVVRLPTALHLIPKLRILTNSATQMFNGVALRSSQNGPIFPAEVDRWHWPFDDPYHAGGSKDEQLSEYRRVPEETRRRIETEFTR